MKLLPEAPEQQVQQQLPGPDLALKPRKSLECFWKCPSQQGTIPAFLSQMGSWKGSAAKGPLVLRNSPKRSFPAPALALLCYKNQTAGLPGALVLISVSGLAPGELGWRPLLCPGSPQLPGPCSPGCTSGTRALQSPCSSPWLAGSCPCPWHGWMRWARRSLHPNLCGDQWPRARPGRGSVPALLTLSGGTRGTAGPVLGKDWLRKACWCWQGSATRGFFSGVPGASSLLSDFLLWASTPTSMASLPRGFFSGVPGANAGLCSFAAPSAASGLFGLLGAPGVSFPGPSLPAPGFLCSSGFWLAALRGFSGRVSPGTLSRTGPERSPALAARRSGEAEARAGLAALGCVSSLPSSPVFLPAAAPRAGCALGSDGAVPCSRRGAGGLRGRVGSASVSRSDSSGLSPELPRKTEALLGKTSLQNHPILGKRRQDSLNKLPK